MGISPPAGMGIINEIATRADAVAHLQVKAPFDSPVALMREMGLAGKTPLVLLDSAGGSPALCRFSFLAWDPAFVLTVKDRFASLYNPENGFIKLKTQDPFSLLRGLLARMKPNGAPRAADLGLPLAGGALGLIGYNACRYIEKLPPRAVDDLGLPDFCFIFPRRLICYDHHKGAAHLFFEDPEPGDIDRAAEALLGSAGQEPAPVYAVDRHDFGLSARAGSNMTRAGYEQMVQRAKEYIFAGDIFQSNLSQRLEMPFAGDSLALYDVLRRINPSPFGGFLDLGGFQLISSSPERLVKLDGSLAQTRPIAGTRGRGAGSPEDDILANELNLDQKERAEHVMLVDLERNDLGKVCSYGSVRVSELMVNEAYSHVIHIVSNVRGRLHEGKDALDLIKAMFPGGTITGCPKVRCMQIIDELEPVSRGPYTGSFGYIGYNGNMDMNIIIRTLVRRDGMVYAQAGAGIVADSDPGREYLETLRKAEAMVKAVRLATEQEKIAERIVS